LTLVLDANVAVAACAETDGFAAFAPHELVAPLMWSESFSFVHEGRFRGEIAPEHARLVLERLEASPVEPREPDGLRRHAWEIADQLGHARTYDAEYVALARILDCRLVTLDLRLRRGADKLGFVVTPAELPAPREPGEPIAERDLVELLDPVGRWPAGTGATVIEDRGEVKILEIARGGNPVHMHATRLKLITKHNP